MIGKRIEDSLVAKLCSIELLAVLIEQAEIDERADVRGKRPSGPLIKLQSRFVIATAIVFDGQAEERAGVFAVGLDRPLEEGDHFRRAAAQCRDRGATLVE